MKWALSSIAFLLLIGALSSPASAAADAEISAAKAAGRPVFLVVTEGNARGTDQAQRIATEAQELAPTAVIVTLDRAKPENARLVQQLRLLGAPVPLILVLAQNGIVAGGALLKDANPKTIAGLIPTPKKAEMLLALGEKRAVFVVVSHAKMLDQSQAFEVTSAAFTRMEQTKQKAQIITVDLNDKAEARFLKELKATPKQKEAKIHVFNAKGQKTGALPASTTVDCLIKAANAKAGCCPGGSCG